MMAGKNRCQCCGKLFVPDRRIGLRQKTCSAACRKVLKSESNKRFSRMNPGYWFGRYDVVRAWRKEHPDYQREWRRQKKKQIIDRTAGEIQAKIFAKALDAVEKSVGLFREIQATITFQLPNIEGQLPGLPCRPA